MSPGVSPVTDEFNDTMLEPLRVDPKNFMTTAATVSINVAMT